MSKSFGIYLSILSASVAFVEKQNRIYTVKALSFNRKPGMHCSLEWVRDRAVEYDCHSCFCIDHKSLRNYVSSNIRSPINFSYHSCDTDTVVFTLNDRLKYGYLQFQEEIDEQKVRMELSDTVIGISRCMAIYLAMLGTDGDRGGNKTSNSYFSSINTDSFDYNIRGRKW